MKLPFLIVIIGVIALLGFIYLRTENNSTSQIVNEPKSGEGNQGVYGSYELNPGTIQTSQNRYGKTSRDCSGIDSKVQVRENDGSPNAVFDGRLVAETDVINCNYAAELAPGSYCILYAYGGCFEVKASEWKRADIKIQAP